MAIAENTQRIFLGDLEEPVVPLTSAINDSSDLDSPVPLTIVLIIVATT